MVEVRGQVLEWTSNGIGSACVGDGDDGGHGLRVACACVGDGDDNDNDDGRWLRFVDKG